jgi:chemotaxis protein MotA
MGIIIKLFRLPCALVRGLTVLAMGSKNIVGIIICLGLFSVGFLFHGNLGLYFNCAGLLIVCGGTFGATLVSFQAKRLSILCKVLLSSYTRKVKEPEEIVEIMVDLSVKRKMRGVLSLQEDEEETSLLFLRRALGFLVDNFRGAQIRDFLTTEINFFKIRREETERILRTMAEIAPAFGLVGSVVGLIGMLSGVGDTENILATLPIALTSTLYGIVLSNFFFIPFAENIRERTHQELVLQKIIMEGVIAIESEIKPRILERKLKSFLTPSSRRSRLVSLQSIQKKFMIPPEGVTQPSAGQPLLKQSRA